MTKNRLKIQTDSVQIELQGDREYVVHSYEAMRGVLMRQFEAVLIETKPKSSPRAIAVAPPQGQRRQPTPVSGVHAPRASRTDTEPLLVVCGDIYNNICALDHDSFQAGIFASSIDVSMIENIFITRTQREQIAQHFQFDKILWRELTAVGKAAVNRSDG